MRQLRIFAFKVKQHEGCGMTFWQRTWGTLVRRMRRLKAVVPHLCLHAGEQPGPARSTFRRRT
tara:strand:- start:143 stop:331 length:189 start_codon:yes stop_codon:yes gene_type:complete